MGIGAFGTGPASKFATELQTRVKSRAPARPLFRFSGGRAALGLESGILSGADELIDCGGNRCVYELRTHRSLNKDIRIAGEQPPIPVGTAVNLSRPNGRELLHALTLFKLGSARL